MSASWVGAKLEWGVLTMVSYHRSAGDVAAAISGAGGFRGGGSRFCACGRPFVFVLGRTSLFGQSDNDERRI